jgi:hypothetical protein
MRHRNHRPALLSAGGLTLGLTVVIIGSLLSTENSPRELTLYELAQTKGGVDNRCCGFILGCLVTQSVCEGRSQQNCTANPGHYDGGVMNRRECNTYVESVTCSQTDPIDWIECNTVASCFWDDDPAPGQCIKLGGQTFKAPITCTPYCGTPP